MNQIAKKCLQALGGQLPDIHGFEGSLRMKVEACDADMNDGGEAGYESSESEMDEGAKAAQER